MEGFLSSPHVSKMVLSGRMNFLPDREPLVWTVFALCLAVGLTVSRSSVGPSYFDVLRIGEYFGDGEASRGGWVTVAPTVKPQITKNKL